MPQTRAPKALHQSIRDQLRYEILSGALSVGQPLKQDALATRFNASRIPVREALRQLEAEGLVVHHLNRGAVVAGMSLEQICEMLTVHATIEEELLYPAARDVLDEADLVDEAAVEHASAKDLIAQIQGMQPADELYDAKVTVLGEYIDHHVKEEEKEMFGIQRDILIGFALTERKRPTQ